jgi:Fe2+ or Zn2+ uptake regulation protein
MTLTSNTILNAFKQKGLRICSKVTEVEACLSPEQIAEVAHRAGLAIEGHRLEFFGRCASCRD